MSNQVLKGKTVLYFSPSFFKYEEMICKKMENLGAHVDYYDERSISTAAEKAVLKVLPSLFTKKTHIYYECIFQKNKNKIYDYVLFTKCEMADEYVLKRCHQYFSEAKYILILWDSLKNLRNVTTKFKYFDQVFSFDRIDCMNHPEMTFRPDFYTDESAAKKGVSEPCYDISFLGTVHSDRYKVIRKVKEFARKNGLKTYMYQYLQGKFMYYYYKIMDRSFSDAKIEEFNFNKISFSEVAEIMARSNAVLEIQHPNQSGLPTRTLDCLALHKKLITTNEDTKNYDFYHPDNIYIIDRNHVQIDLTFFQKPYHEIPSKIYEKYSLEYWIKEILGVLGNEA